VPFYEICFETGVTSVAFYEDDAEAERAIAEHHRRAINGEEGGPLGGPAERIAKVFKYKKHPNDMNPDQTMSADVLKKEAASLIDAIADENGVVAVDQLVVGVRGLTHPMVESRESAHESIYKMKESSQMDMAFLAGVE
jgi:2-keto-3-deoxy-L-rhamnonate aldolase RhmA